MSDATKKNEHAAELARMGAAKGGRARAEKLTAEERSMIAREAALVRWGDNLPRATHSGVLEIGNARIPCYVLENGERILSTRGVMASLKRSWRGRKYPGTELPVFLEAKNLKPFISSDLAPVLKTVEFRTDAGAKSEGFRAEILPSVCEVYLRARDSGALKAGQGTVAKQCEILVRGLSQIGIIALVDEATGYQDVRDRQALQAILEKYLTDEWAAWTKTFPDEYYRELFRLRGMPYPSVGKNKPSYIGHLTNDIVYSRLAPGVKKELQSKNPRRPSGNRARRHHQHLTRDYGHPELTDHLQKVIFLMRACDSWSDFKLRLDRAATKYGDTFPLALSLPVGAEDSENA